MKTLMILMLMISLIFLGANLKAQTVTYEVYPKYVGAVGAVSTLEQPIACYVRATGLDPNSGYDGLHTGLIFLNSTSTRGSKWEPTLGGWISPSTTSFSKYTADGAGNFSTWIYVRPPTSFAAGVDTVNIRFRIQKNGTVNTINTDSPSPLSSITYEVVPMSPTAGAIIYGYVNPTAENLGKVILAYENVTDTRPLSAWLIYKTTTTIDTNLYNTRMDPALRTDGYFQLLVPANRAIRKLEMRNSQNIVTSFQTSTLWMSSTPGTMTNIGLQDSIVLSVRDEGTGIPDNFGLYQNYPNPFNPSTDIRFQIAKSGFVSLKIFDNAGREIAKLVNGEMEIGTYTATWDASNVASGVYYYKLQSSNFSKTRKIILIK